MPNQFVAKCSTTVRCKPAMKQPLSHNSKEGRQCKVWGIGELTPLCTVLIEKPTVSRLVKKSPAFYGTRRSIAAFARVRDMSLPCAKSIKFTPSQPISFRSILLLSPHLRVGLPSCLFPSGSPHWNAVCTSPLTHTCHMLHQSDSKTVRSEEHKSQKPSFRTCCRPVSSFVGLRNFNTLPGPLNLCSSLSKRQARGKTIVLCVWGPRVFKYQVEGERFLAASKFIKLLSLYDDPCQWRAEHCRVMKVHIQQQ